MCYISTPMCCRTDVLQEYKVSERWRMPRRFSSSFIHVLLFGWLYRQILWTQWVFTSFSYHRRHLHHHHHRHHYHYHEVYFRQKSILTITTLLNKRKNHESIACVKLEKLMQSLRNFIVLNGMRQRVYLKTRRAELRFQIRFHCRPNRNWR